MYKVKPENSRNIMHSLDGETNYSASTMSKYEKAIAEQKQVEIEAAKKAAEAEKEAAANLAKLKAEAPKLNTGKVLGRDLSSLKKTEIPCKNGKTIRLYRDPETNKLLVKTVDQGIGHEEWFYGGKADKIYLHQIGDRTPYIVAKKGNYTQIYGSPKYKTTEEFLVYNGEDASLRLNSFGFDNAEGVVKINDCKDKYKVKHSSISLPDTFDPDVIEANNVIYNKVKQALTKIKNDAQPKILDFYDLLQNYKA
jgi:hypothetical protein